jgi:DNA polymerase V
VADPDPWLAATAIEDVWGIGRQLSRWCRLRGIADARALRDMPAGELRRRAGVVGLRLQQELQGRRCLPLASVAPAKRETCVSRSFSTPVSTAAALKEAVATYLCRAAEKLRRQGQRAGSLTVFVRSSPFDGTAFYANAATTTLPLPSNDTAVLLAAALPMAERLFRPHKPLRKAGVIFVGKTNSPEFGLGSHTFNPVWGTTRNPWDLTRSAGGSTGGGAVALALDLLPLADGSDYGGSLRNPAGWNNVFGLRPSLGRVPGDGPDDWLTSMGVAVGLPS